MKRMCCGFDDHKMKFYALAQAVKRMTMFYQRPGMTNEEYKKHFDALWDTVRQFGGSHGSITGKAMIRIICFDHITTATTPLPNLLLMKRMSYNYKVIDT